VFLFKKLLSNAMMPLSLCVLLLLLGLVLLWFTRRQKAGKVLVTTGSVLLLTLGYGWGFSPALKALEREYPPVTAAVLDAKWVVVLGGGTFSDEEIPLHSRLSEASLGRLVEGIRLYRQIQGAKLLVSGGRVFGSGSDAESMRELAVSLGVNSVDIRVDEASQDTETQALIIRQMVGDDKVLLVTSASHMPRSVGLFKLAGVNVMPAPAHYVVQDNAEFGPADLFPDSENILAAQRLVYEYLGIFWAKMRGRL
jgi:uncharacterized SAM-binding protein YcdF (DUF218 family)